MDYSLFFNHLSLLAASEEEAYLLLNNSFQGVLNLNKSGDRFFLYFDGESLDDCKLSENFTYGDFKNKLSDDDRELRLFIYQMEDKSPMIDNLSEQLTEELSQISSYFPNRPYDDNLDIFTIAWLQQGIMLSLATKDFWNTPIIKFLASKEKTDKPIQYEVYNISQEEHAKFILEKKFFDYCSDTIFTDNFKSWYEESKQEDKNKIKGIITHCYNNEFILGRPIIDTIKNSSFSNMKEIRVGNPHGQRGKIRILFAMTPNKQPAILHGFIKHSNDYTEHIEKADKLFKDLLNND